jgi:predicted ATP-dependent protease
MLKFLSILLVTTVFDWSFSTLKRIKTYFRNSTSKDKLNGLALINVHRNIDLDIESIVDVFVNKKESRLNFNYNLNKIIQYKLFNKLLIIININPWFTRMLGMLNV